MKRLIGLLAALLFAAVSYAQTAEEIVAKMEEVMGAHEKDGIIMTMDIKMPIIGTLSTRTWFIGDKYRTEGGMKNVKLVSVCDGTTEWTYDGKSNEITIVSVDPDHKSDEASDAEMFHNVTEGYDVSIKKETATEWQILCKKSKDNTNKDDPKTMTLVVAKGTFYPVSISAKMSGVTVTLRDVDFGVDESVLTFNISDYPGAKIIDKR